MAADSSSAVRLPVYTCDVDMPLLLMPAWLSDPMEGVREQLNKSVLRYVSALGGVLLSYTGLKFQRQLGRIVSDLPEVHVKVQCQASYFGPRVGDLIEAVVSRVGSDHVALLVLGVFNATVPHPTGVASPSVDDSVVFAVRSLRHAEGLLTMHGELVERPSGGAAGGAPRTPAAAKPSKKRGRDAEPTPGESGGSGTGGKRSKEEKRARKEKKAAKAAANAKAGA